MGDVLLATPLVRILRARYPNARIDVAVAQRFAEVWQHNPHISSLVEVDTTQPFYAAAAIKKSLRRDRSCYDVVIDAQRNLRSWYLRRGMAKHTLLYDKHRAEKIALVRKKQYPEQLMPVAERYIQAAAALGVKADGKGVELWLPEEQNSVVYPPELCPRNSAIRKVALAPGARHATKRWLPQRFAELGAKLVTDYNIEVVLLGGKDDAAICREITSAAGGRLVDMSGSTSLYDTARIIDSCGLLITNDSGVMHIGAARRVPTLAIFGSTVPELGFAPYGTRSVIVEKHLPCRPCTHIGQAQCPEGHFRCMKDISVDEVMQAAERIMRDEV